MNDVERIVDLRISTDAVKHYIRLLRDKAGNDWEEVKLELLAAIEEIDMINPTHLIKQFPNGFNHKIPYINSRDELVWITHHERGWLGSGVTDCNGVEIFEGDIVRYIPEPHEWSWHEEDELVVFLDSAFVLINMSDIDYRETCGATPFVMENFKKYKVVGHIATEEKKC